MPIPSAFKTDESFLQKLAMGAAATQRTFEDLKANGHDPMELERGSTGFKIWKEIKIKRLRLPDVLCLRCGLRVESRGKAKLEITMSHSRARADRAWDAGLDDPDLVALVACEKVGDDPTAWRASELVQYVPVRFMRDAFKAGLVRTHKPKGAQEGAEVRVTWPAAVSDGPGRVKALEPSALRYVDGSGRERTVRLKRENVTLQPVVAVGSRFEAKQILASSVPVLTTPPCGTLISTANCVELTRSLSLTDRYMAVKALGRMGDASATDALRSRIADPKEDIYVQLDAAASLLRLGIIDGASFFEETLGRAHESHRLEAVIVLGEVGSPEAVRLLMQTLANEKESPEIRAGAAWALGTAGEREALPALIESFIALDLRIRIEAARALARLARVYLADVVGALQKATPDQRPGIAWALAKAGGVTVEHIVPALGDVDSRQWIAYVLGSQPQGPMLTRVEDLARRDPEVYFAVTVLWKILTSWVHGLEEH
jgi:HEAT repeat protein